MTVTRKHRDTHIHKIQLLAVYLTSAGVAGRTSVLLTNVKWYKALITDYSIMSSFFSAKILDYMSVYLLWIFINFLTGKALKVTELNVASRHVSHYLSRAIFRLMQSKNKACTGTLVITIVQWMSSCTHRGVNLPLSVPIGALAFHSNLSSCRAWQGHVILKLRRAGFLLISEAHVPIRYRDMLANLPVTGLSASLVSKVKIYLLSLTAHGSYFIPCNVGRCLE